MFQAAEAKSPNEPATLGALFIGFLKVSLCGFGGGLVWARRIVVERKRWMDEQEFVDALPIYTRTKYCRHYGLRRIEAKRVGWGDHRRRRFILIPWTIGLSLGALYLQYAHVALLQKILGGLSAAAAGLLIATGIRLLLPHRSRRVALVFATLAFAGIVVLKLPLLIVLLGLAPLSIAAAGLESPWAR
jgi:chromate transporter